MLDEIVGDTRQVLWIFLGAVSCVLMIGVANLISLQIVRNSTRERELCVRAALGAGRWRLVQQPSGRNIASQLDRRVDGYRAGLGRNPGPARYTAGNVSARRSDLR